MNDWDDYFKESKLGQIIDRVVLLIVLVTVVCVSFFVMKNIGFTRDDILQETTTPAVQLPLVATPSDILSDYAPATGNETELVAEDAIPLTGDEIDLLFRIVMAESGNQSELGQMAVAQCIRETMEREELLLEDVVLAPNQYASPFRGEVTEQTKRACCRVFFDGERAVADTIEYFYSTAGGFYSKWHENQTWVCTIGDHKFFKGE